MAAWSALTSPTLVRVALTAGLLAACGHDEHAAPGESKDASVRSVQDAAPVGARDASALDGRAASPTLSPPGDAKAPSTNESGPALERDGAAPSRDASSQADAEGARDAGGSGRVPLFVAVGYGGLRVSSRDLGKSWQHEVKSGGGGDDPHLLRGVTIANGLVVATGHRVWTSRDGASWEQRTNPTGAPENAQWMGWVRYGNGLFVSAGGYGDSFFSSDGVSWMRGGKRENEPARSVAFGAGVFMAATDQGTWWKSTDGKQWSVDSRGHQDARGQPSALVVWCNDAFREPHDCSSPDPDENGRVAFGEGIYVAVGSNKLQRSEDQGKSWTSVYSGPVENVAFGYLDAN